MSIDTCSKCGDLVDTDFDMEFYGPDGEGFGKYTGLCENCREALESELIEQEKSC